MAKDLETIKKTDWFKAFITNPDSLSKKDVFQYEMMMANPERIAEGYFTLHEADVRLDAGIISVNDIRGIKVLDEDDYVSPSEYPNLDVLVGHGVCYSALKEHAIVCSVKEIYGNLVVDNLGCQLDKLRFITGDLIVNDSFWDEDGDYTFSEQIDCVLDKDTRELLPATSFRILESVGSISRVSGNNHFTLLNGDDAINYLIKEGAASRKELMAELNGDEGPYWLGRGGEYVIHEDEPLGTMFPSLKSVKGDFELCCEYGQEVYDFAKLCPSLERIQGTLYCCQPDTWPSSLKDLSGLTVWGYGHHKVMNGFCGLQNIFGDLSIKPIYSYKLYENGKLVTKYINKEDGFSVNFKDLESVSGNVFMSSDAFVGMPNLVSVGGDLDLNSHVHLKNISHVGGDIYYVGNDKKVCRHFNGDNPETIKVVNRVLNRKRLKKMESSQNKNLVKKTGSLIKL